MKKGISLIEILIALGLSSFVFLIASTLLVTILTSNTKSSRNEIFEQAKNDLAVSLTNEMKWAEKVEFVPGNPAVLVLNDGKTKYEMKSGSIMKNEIQLTPESIKVTSFTIENLSNDVELASLRIQIEMESSQLSSVKDRVSIVASQRKLKQEVAK